MTELEVLVDGIDFGEGPRWHEGRLWYSDFYQNGVFAVTPDGVREQVLALSQQPSGLGWLPDGRLLVVSMLDQKLLVVDDGDVTEYADLSAIAVDKCNDICLLYTSPSPRDATLSRMPSSA